jgi:ABC-2 type transport system ATP-binding protein
MPPILSVKNLKKVYPGKPPVVAVGGISFELGEGEILGLLGPNGSGKTTTIQMLLDILSLSEGSIEYFGMDLQKNRSEVLKQVAFASTYTNLPWILTVEENLVVLGRLYGLNKRQSLERALPLLERFGINHLRKRRAGSLSAGQNTRLTLVKAFFTQPRVLLLDEPTASLDPDVAKEICDFLLEQREKTKVSILFCSHKMEEVMAVCDRVVVLKDGKVIASDLPENLAKSVSAFRVKLLVSEGMEKLVGILDARGLMHVVEHRAIEIHLEESAIPSLLQEIHNAGIIYASIRIEEPSLEEYFLSIAGAL